MKEFVHLHVHTHYSLLESTVKVPDLVTRVKEMGQPAVAVTDLGNMFGAVDFYLAAKAAGVKPILGAEIFYTSGSRHQKPLAGKGARRVFAAAGDAEGEAMRLFHLVLLCKNATGYRNLCEIVTRGYTEGFHNGKPRVDRELIGQWSEGVIALTAGLKGETAYHCVHGRPDRAEETVKWLRDAFRDDLFLELQENGLPEQARANRMIAEIARRMSVPVVAAADVHYLRPEPQAGGGLSHEVLLSIGDGRRLNEDKGVRLAADEFWLKDGATISRQFEWIPEAVSNTALVAERCGFEFRLKDEKGRPIYHLPDYREEGGGAALLSVDEVLRQQAREGLRGRFKGAEPPAAYAARLTEELDMIVKTGFAGYFLVVADFIGFAKGKGIPVGPGRGSGAGSLVAYALRITDIDPIPFNLLFERFINPERVSMPDFDVDFCQDRRGEVIEYVVGKYGRDRVSQIITFGKLLARGVIRDVGRVLELTYSEVDQIAKLVPEELGITLETAFEREARLQDLADRDPRMRSLFETARALEGLNRHASVHAAGVVITNRPLVEYCPLYIGKDGETVIQYDKDFAEKIGLVKFDFLGLKTLTVIDNAVKFVGGGFTLEAIDYSDPNVYKLISSGDTDGIFQLESSGMKDLCVRVEPSNLEDITAINALYRPGPLNSGMVDDFINRKHARTEVTYELPQLREILEETYGVIVYQEQVMRVARVLAGYSLGEADILRRAMGKKKPEEMAKQKDKFIEGCARNGVGHEQATRLFELLAKFAEYGFNKSHSAAYGVLSFQTAYLKTYYPAEFMAALMATEMDNTDKMSQYISDARAHGIAILPPDVNESGKTFTVVPAADAAGKAIRFGLEAIKGVGGVAVDAILAERASGGPFHGFTDFCRRVPLRKVNKKVVECLIATGAFDSVAEHNRATLFESIEEVMERAAKQQAEADLGQVSFFDQYKAEELKLENQTRGLFKEVADWPESKKLQMEKQLVGFYVSGHPMDRWWQAVKSFVHGDLGWIREEFEKRRNGAQASSGRSPVAGGGDWRKARDANRWEVTTAALVTQFREILTKKGSRMAFAEIEDARDRIEVVVFPEAYEQHGEKIKKSVEECQPFILGGSIGLDEDSPKLFLRTMEPIEDFQKKKINSVVLALDPGQVNPHLLAQLRAVLVKHRGRCSAFLEYTGSMSGTGFKSRMALPQELSVNPTAEMVQEVNHLFGREVVRFV